MNILVVGGAGYIGSHMVQMLGQRGCEVTTLDNLSSGHRDAVLCGRFVHGDLADTALLTGLLAHGKFDAVMHFASFIQVGESVAQPAKYYRNNVSNTLNLLEVMQAVGVKRFIFSSTAATFGEPQYTPIDEAHPQRPINPYGRTKLMVEQALADLDSALGLKSVSLRYFNAAGADPAGRLGERHDPETHLIPLVLQAATAGRRPIRNWPPSWRMRGSGSAGQRHWLLGAASDRYRAGGDGARDPRGGRPSPHGRSSRAGGRQPPSAPASRLDAGLSGTVHHRGACVGVGAPGNGLKRRSHFTAAGRRSRRRPRAQRL